MPALLRLHHIVGVGLSSVEFLTAELAVGDGVSATDIPGYFSVRDTVHLQRVETTEGCDLLEGKGGVFDQPNGGRFRH